MPDGKLGFSKNIDENVDLLTELLQGIPASRRGTARAVAMRIENVLHNIQKDYARDPVAGLGVAFAIMLTAQRMVDVEGKGGEKSLIQLLS
jgi:hypothetical protein